MSLRAAPFPRGGPSWLLLCLTLVRRSLFHSRGLIVGAALQIALNIALLTNLVVCQSDSGHVAIESIFDADCCDDHAGHAPARIPEAAPGCDCVDTPLFRAFVVRDAREHLKLERALAMHVLPADLPISVASFRIDHALIDPPAVQSSLPRSLRSVVLLV
jgi:hypothetical protein